jgi:hypothetical protein
MKVFPRHHIGNPSLTSVPTLGYMSIRVFSKNLKMVDVVAILLFVMLVCSLLEKIEGFVH